MSLPPPEAEEVERGLGRISRQLRKDFSGVEAEWEEDDWERVQAEGIQARLGLESGEVEPAQGRRRRRVAVLEGFSLHADTWVSGGDRGGLERLLRYAARGPLAGSKLRREEDGRYRYESRKGRVVRLTAVDLVKRLLAVVPPARMHLTAFHGVFAPNGRRRGEVMGERRVEEGRVLRPPTGEGKEKKARRPRLDWGTLRPADVRSGRVEVPVRREAGGAGGGEQPADGGGGAGEAWAAEEGGGEGAEPTAKGKGAVEVRAERGMRG